MWRLTHPPRELVEKLGPQCRPYWDLVGRVAGMLLPFRYHQEHHWYRAACHLNCLAVRPTVIGLEGHLLQSVPDLRIL